MQVKWASVATYLSILCAKCYETAKLQRNTTGERFMEHVYMREYVCVCVCLFTDNSESYHTGQLYAPRRYFKHIFLGGGMGMGEKIVIFRFSLPRDMDSAGQLYSIPSSGSALLLEA